MGPRAYGEPEERQQRIARERPFLLVRVGERHGFQFAVRAVQRLHRGDVERDLPFGLQRAHAFDRMGCGAKPIAVVHQRQRLRQRLKVQHPVERAVATAGDDHVLPLNASIFFTA